MLRLTRLRPAFYSFSPDKHHMGTCPLYGHKYYSIPPQKYAFGSEILQEKREVDYEMKTIMGREPTKNELRKFKADPSVKINLVNDIHFQWFWGGFYFIRK